MRFSPRMAATTFAVAAITATPTAVAAITATPTAVASTSQGQFEVHHAQTSTLGRLVPTSSIPAVTTPPTVAGPTTPTTNEPGDNHPALVIGGGLISLGLIAGGWTVARTRIKDDE